MSPIDTVDRIFELLDAADMEQQAFAAAVGVSDDTASNWRRRRSASYSKYLPQIAEVLETTVQWLLTGYGTKLKEPTSEPEKKELTPAKEGESRDPLDTRIMDLASSLSPAQKKTLIEKMEFLISMQ